MDKNSNAAITIPNAFWKKMSYAEMSRLLFFNDGRMTTKQTKLLWKTLRRTDAPPKAFVVDIDALPPDFHALRELGRVLNAGPLPNVDDRTIRRMLDMPD